MERRINHLIQVAVACLVLPAIAAAPHAGGSAGAAPGPQAYAIVELFTSQGCSSCPPADALLADLSSQARRRGLPIYCLAFHVDYWDQLGWKDPFSAAAYSDRQKDYARAMHSQRIYTPQMIVNGTEEFVGSDRTRADRAINRALEHAGPVSVTLRAADSGPPPADTRRSETSTAARLTYSVVGAPAGAVLHLAAVEHGLVSPVAGGENAGRVLRDDNVVRTFTTLPLAKGTDGAVTVTLPRGTVSGRTAVIAYVQDPATMAILAATTITFP